MSTETASATPTPASAATTLSSPPNTSPPPPAPPSTVTPAAAGAPTEWTTGLSADLQGYVQTKGFKAPQDVLESYRNYEKLQGVPQDRLLKLPENLDTPEGRAIFEKLGLPKDAKEYQIDIPKENGDQALADWIRSTAFKNGFTKKQAEGLVKDYNERTKAERDAATEAFGAKVVTEQNNLKTEWGNSFDQNMNVARAAVKTMGWTKEQINSMEAGLGYAGVMKLLHKIGAATGEHEFVGGQPAGGSVLTPESAIAKINSLIMDQSFQARIKSQDADALKQWDNLHKMAYPGTVSL